ncbi:MAG: hypothetical protein DRJ67_01080 [Thermoprotei archaeon]|nr:MAG: hypothetical protein DRJ67_01080 [Thermoprotei archaeon]
MPNGNVSPREAFDRVLRIAASFSNETRHKLAQAYQGYLNTLPPEHREMMMAIMAKGRTIVVKRSEIPRRILEDDEFFHLFLQHLSAIAAKRRR